MCFWPIRGEHTANPCQQNCPLVKHRILGRPPLDSSLRSWIMRMLWQAIGSRGCHTFTHSPRLELRFEDDFIENLELWSRCQNVKVSWWHVVKMSWYHDIQMLRYYVFTVVLQSLFHDVKISWCHNIILICSSVNMPVVFQYHNSKLMPSLNLITSWLF